MSELFERKRIPITDDYMFGYVMRQPGMCKRVIECLLPEMKIADVKFKDEEASATTQKTIQGNMGSRSVRLDVYLDDGQSVYNVEMQTGNKKNLPKRVRFYGGRIDCDQLEKTQDYNELCPTYVIFICTFDPFGQGQYHYSFENRCAEVEGLKLGDESYKLFFNAAGQKGEISEELKALLDYFMNPENIPEGEKTKLVKEIDDLVDFANHDEDWRRGYMTFAQDHMDAINEGIAIGETRGIAIGEKRGIAIGKTEGIAIGEAKGRANGIIETLLSLVRKNLLSVKDASEQAAMSEKDFSALLAAK